MNFTGELCRAMLFESPSNGLYLDIRRQLESAAIRAGVDFSTRYTDQPEAIAHAIPRLNQMDFTVGTSVG